MTRILLGLIVVITIPQMSIGAVLSNFESGADGWMTINLSQPIPNPPTIVGPGNPISLETGNPGTAVGSTDPDGNAWYFSAPAKFLGNQSAFFGEALSWDMRILGTPNPGPQSVVLVGGGLTLFGPTQFSGPNPTPNGNWNTFSLSLVGASFDTVWGNPNSDATDGQLNTVLGNLSALYILGDWNDGNEETHLDNVTLVPEPSSAALATLAFAVLFRRVSRVFPLRRTA